MFAQSLIAWFATYFLHSAVLLGAAWTIAAFTRARRSNRVLSTERLWRVALFGALLSATVQMFVVSQMDRPASPSTPLGSEVPATAESTVFGLLSVSGTNSSMVVQRVATPALESSQWVMGAWALVAAALFSRRMVQRRRFLSGLGERRSLTTLERERLREHEPSMDSATSRVRLTVSSQLVSPVVLSQTEVCLPERALQELPESALASMLAHEYAHIERRDPIWLVVYQALEAALFFQPLVFVATRALRNDSELASDRKAVEGGADAVFLADSLALVAQWGTSSPVALGVLGERESSLTTRVRALLDMEGDSRSTSRAATVLIGALLLGLACSGPAVEGTSGPSGRPAADAPVDLYCELVSDSELRVDGATYQLPAEWDLFEQTLRRHAERQELTARGDSTLRIALAAGEEVDFTRILHVMGRCGYARIWDVNLVRAEGGLLPVPLPVDPGVLHEPVEIEELEHEEELDQDSVGSASAPRDGHPEVCLRKDPSGSLEYRVGDEAYPRAGPVLEALSSLGSGSPPRSIVVDVRRGVSFAEACGWLDALRASDLGEVPVVFIGAWE